MPRSILFSLVACLILISGAVWKRVDDAQATTGNFVAVQTATSSNAMAAQDILNSNLAALTDASTSPVASSSEPVTETTQISHQLFSDYLNMALSGQSTQDNLTALGSQYAANIGSLNQSPRIAPSSLNSVENSKANIQAYAVTFSAIYHRYEALLNTQFKNHSVTGVGPEFTTLMTNTSNLYGQEAKELEAMPVPALLVTDHSRLINVYLSNAWAMNAAANEDADPTTAFAGIVVEKTNLSDEQTELDTIQKILDQYGI